MHTNGSYRSECNCSFFLLSLKEHHKYLFALLLFGVNVGAFFNLLTFNMGNTSIKALSQLRKCIGNTGSVTRGKLMQIAV